MSFSIIRFGRFTCEGDRLSFYLSLETIIDELLTWHTLCRCIGSALLRCSSFVGQIWWKQILKLAWCHCSLLHETCLLYQICRTGILADSWLPSQRKLWTKVRDSETGWTALGFSLDRRLSLMELVGLRHWRMIESDRNVIWLHPNFRPDKQLLLLKYLISAVRLHFSASLHLNDFITHTFYYALCRCVCNVNWTSFGSPFCSCPATICIIGR